MLPAGLRMLLRLRARGYMRKSWRALRKPRTAIPQLLVLGNMVFVVSMMTLGRLVTAGEPSIYDLVTEDLVAAGLSTLFAFALISPVFEFPLVFQTAEIQFLYPAPLRRTALTQYKLASYAPIVAVIGLIGATMIEGGTTQWFLAVPGMLVYSTFTLLSTVALGLLVGLPRMKFAVLCAMAAAIIVASVELLPLVRSARSLTDLENLAGLLRETTTVKLLVATGLPFAHTVVHGFSTQWLINFGITLALTIALFAVVLKLDVNFYEASIAATARREARLERLRRGRVGRGTWSGARRVRVRMLPRLGGAGPTLYRHLTAALRERSVIWVLAIVVAVPAGAGIYVHSMGIRDFNEIRKVTLWITIYTAFILSNILRFDFRSDYSMLDHLKVLPVNPFALAAGTIAIPVVFALSVQILPPVTFALASGVSLISLTWVVFLVPCNIMWFALNNAFYLRAPTPAHRGLQSNPTAVGHQLFASVAVGLTLGLVAACAAGIYYLARVASGSLTVAQLAASGFLWPCAAGAVFLTGRAFRDLDLGRDRV